MPSKVPNGKTPRSSGPSKRRGKSRKNRSRNPRSCLFIECDCDRLQADGLRFANELDAVVSAFPLETKVVSIQSTETALDQLAQIASIRKTFDIVVIIGHGNAQGLQFTNDLFASYPVISEWVGFFKPKTLFLVTCKGGHSVPTEILFRCSKTLQSIYASPVNTTKSAMAIISMIIPALSMAGEIPKNVLRAIQALNFLVTDGILLHHTRTNFMRNIPLENLLDQVFPLAIPAKRAAENLIKAVKERIAQRV